MRFRDLSTAVARLSSPLAKRVALGVERRDTRIVCGEAPELQNWAGTVRVLCPRLLALVTACFLLGPLLGTPAAAVPPVVYASPAQDGNPPLFPPLPISSSGNLDLWIETGPSATPAGSQEICFDGQGDEICAWQIEIETTGGITITSFVEAIEDSTNPLQFAQPSARVLRISRLNAAPPNAGDFGRMHIGMLYLNVAGLGDVVLTADSQAIDADLEQLALGQEVIASPEPGWIPGLFASLLLLAALAGRRARRRLLLRATSSCLALLTGSLLLTLMSPTGAGAQSSVCTSGGEWNGGTLTYRPESPALPVVVHTMSGYTCNTRPSGGILLPLASQISFSSTHPLALMGFAVSFDDVSFPASATATVTLSDGLGAVDSRILSNFGPADNLLVDSSGSTHFTLSSSHPVWIIGSTGGVKAHCGDAFTDLADPDEDGLPTAWEICGLKIINGGVQNFTKICFLEPCDLDLPAMGADPMHKDLFLELDWMRRGPHMRGHWPRKWGIRKLVDAFMNAPVENPDSTTGIHLHVDAGPFSVMNPANGESWGDLGRSNSIGHIGRLGSCSEIPDFEGNGCSLAEYLTIWSAFDTIKNGPSGSGGNFDEVRRPVFRYGLLAHRIDGPATGVWPGKSGGIARNSPTADFIVALGGWHLPSGGGKPLEQGATIMHELGHGLGLDHGGDDLENFKPNYLSVMNYSFANGGLIRDGVGNQLDYSRWTLPMLDESSLAEIDGISGSDPQNQTELVGYGTRWACPPGLCSTSVTDCSSDAECSGSDFCGLGLCSESRNPCNEDFQCAGLEFCAFGFCAQAGLPCFDNAECPIGDHCKRLIKVRDDKIASGYLDWNCSDSIDVSNVVADLNASQTLSPLTGNWNDWLAIQYSADHIGTLTPTVSSTFIGDRSDVPYEFAELIRNELNVQIEADADFGLRPGLSRQLSFNIQNTGRQPDTYSLLLLSDQGWASAAIPPTVMLAVDEQLDLVITVQAPAVAALGLVDEVGIQATSQTEVTLVSFDSTIVDIFSCGDVTRNAVVDEADVRRLRTALLKPLSAPLSDEGLRRCSVAAPDASCDLLDLVVLARAAADPFANPGILQTCETALP